jgi:hypothetical protein
MWLARPGRKAIRESNARLSTRSTPATTPMRVTAHLLEAG